MKIIKLFLILTIVSLSSTGELTLPKCIKYESMKKVIENDWSHANKCIQQFVEHNSAEYVDTFIRLATQQLVLKTDKEYIKENLNRHKKSLNDETLPSSILPHIDNMVEYEKRIREEVKYKIYYFDRYNNHLDISSYRMIFMYIRHLEYSHRYEEAFILYDTIAQNLLNLYNTNDKNHIYTMIFNIVVEDYIKMLSISLKENKYNKHQKNILHNVLSQCIVDKDFLSKILHSERNHLSKVLDMFYLNENMAISNISTKEMFFKDFLKIVDKKNIEMHLNNKDTMQRFVDNFKSDIENIHKKILGFKSLKEYETYDEQMSDFQNILGYVDMGRIAILYILDKMEFISLSQFFKYEFTNDEFVEKVVNFYVIFGKPWVWGKYKFEYEERFEKNREFLKLLK